MKIGMRPCSYGFFVVLKFQRRALDGVDVNDNFLTGVQGDGTPRAHHQCLRRYSNLRFTLQTLGESNQHCLMLSQIFTKCPCRHGYHYRIPLNWTRIGGNKYAGPLARLG